MLAGLVGLFCFYIALTVFAQAIDYYGHYYNPAHTNHSNDHYAVASTNRTILNSFDFWYIDSNNIPVSPHDFSGTPVAMYVYLCNGTPPVWPNTFDTVSPGPHLCPDGSYGLIGYSPYTYYPGYSMSWTSAAGPVDLTGRYVLVRSVYSAFTNTGEIWTQQQNNPDGVWSKVTFNFAGGITLPTDVVTQFGYCGDGITNGPETCDAGVGGVATVSATCTISCQIPTTPGTGGRVCGNNVVESGETCDDGNIVSGDSCSSSCQIEGTGNGSLSGVCGTDDGTSTSTVPTNLCSAGTASAVTDNGTTWDWTCAGSSSTATCQATHTLTTGSTGNACSFVIARDPDGTTVFPATLPGSIPTVAPQRRVNSYGDRWVVPVQLDPNADALCFDPALLNVQVRTESINAEYRHNPANQTLSAPLNLDDPATYPQYEFDATAGILYLPVQNKQSYEITANVYDPATGTAVLPAPASSAYFDTRIPQIEIIGPARVQTDGGVGDTNFIEVRNIMNPSIARILQPFEHSLSIGRCDATNGVTLSSLNPNETFYEWSAATNSHSTLRTLSECMSADGRVIYFDPTPSAGPAWIEFAGNAVNEFMLPNRATTLLLRGTDLHLSADLKYPLLGFGGSFGVISLKNTVNSVTYGGNVLVNPAPTSIVGAYYIEGSVIAAEAGWKVPTDAGMPSRDNTAWYDTFHNQLYWQGTIISRNTVEASIDSSILPTATADAYASTPQCPAADGLGVTVCTWPEAVAYDLAHLREFHRCLNPSSLTTYSSSWSVWGCTTNYVPGTSWEIVDDEDSARAATGLPNRLDNTSVVIKYDGRLSSNPPPGFEGVSSLLQKEIGL